MVRMILVLLLALPLSGCDFLEKYMKPEGKLSCEDQVKRDYPVPPNNINEQKQMIDMKCKQGE